MRNKILVLILCAICTTSCVSIPKETVNLSTAIGNDLKNYHNTHSNMVKLYYDKIKNDINIFIDDVYAPYIKVYINSLLNARTRTYTKTDLQEV